MLYTQIIVLLISICSIMDIRALLWLKEMKILNAELIVFLTIGLFMAIVSSQFARFFYSIKARHDKQLSFQIRNILTIKLNNIDRLHKLRKRGFIKNRTSFVRDSSKFYILTINDYSYLFK